jgi:hypothetical protein
MPAPTEICASRAAPSCSAAPPDLRTPRIGPGGCPRPAGSGSRDRDALPGALVHRCPDHRSRAASPRGSADTDRRRPVRTRRALSRLHTVSVAVCAPAESLRSVRRRGVGRRHGGERTHDRERHREPERAGRLTRRREPERAPRRGIRDRIRRRRGGVVDVERRRASLGRRLRRRLPLRRDLRCGPARAEPPEPDRRVRQPQRGPSLSDLSTRHGVGTGLRRLGLRLLRRAGARRDRRAGGRRAPVGGTRLSPGARIA